MDRNIVISIEDSDSFARDKTKAQIEVLDRFADAVSKDAIEDAHRLRSLLTVLWLGIDQSERDKWDMAAVKSFEDAITHKAIRQTLPASTAPVR